MHSRREALKKLAGIAATASVGTGFLAACGGGRDVEADDLAAASVDGDSAEAVLDEASALVPIVGVQLYSLRSEMEKDVAATLTRVARIGCREVEFAGYFGKSPQEIAAILKTAGLTAPAAHIQIGDIRTKLDETLAAAMVMGHRYVVCPSIPAEEQGSADGYRKVAADLNSAATAAKAHDITIAYHNHAFEFDDIAGTNGFDILLAETDPMVKFELDLAWATKAGRDPLELFAAYPGRFALVHVKDLSADGNVVDVGKGTIPFARIFRQASQGGIRHYFLEHDNPPDPFAFLTASYRAVRRIPAGR